MKHPLAILALLTWAAFATACACGQESPTHEITLYQTNQSPLATLHLVLPRTISTNLSGGQWRGELSSTYVRPKEHVLFASDMLKAPSWKELQCRVDGDDPRLIHINLQPNQPDDHIIVWIPAAKGSSAESRWYHWTDGGAFEGGTVKAVHK